MYLDSNTFFHDLEVRTYHKITHNYTFTVFSAFKHYFIQYLFHKHCGRRHDQTGVHKRSNHIVTKFTCMRYCNI